MKSFVGNNVLYRLAQLEDAQSIVIISLEIWRTTYKGLIKDEIIEARFDTINNRIEKTIDLIKNGNEFIVAESNHEIIGYIQFCKSVDNEYLESGQIKALYIKDNYQRMGIGQILFLNALNELRLMRYKKVVIDCLIGNKANEFYLKMGTHIDSQKEELFMGEILKENVHIIDLNH